jgi:hypothetical protein
MLLQEGVADRSLTVDCGSTLAVSGGYHGRYQAVGLMSVKLWQLITASVRDKVNGGFANGSF